MEVNAARFYKRCAPKYRAAEGRNRRQHGASIRAPENRSEARFLGKRSGRRSERGGKQSAPSAMAPWRDERTAGFPLPHDFFFRQLERKSVNKGHSTVTLFARLRGRSGSCPRRRQRRQARYCSGTAATAGMSGSHTAGRRQKKSEAQPSYCENRAV